jgi:hypothetical protein
MKMANRNQQRDHHAQSHRDRSPRGEAEDDSRGDVVSSKSSPSTGDSLISNETNANDNWEPENSRGPRGYGHSQAYGGALGYQDETLRAPEISNQKYDRVDRPKPTKIK